MKKMIVLAATLLFLISCGGGGGSNSAGGNSADRSNVSQITEALLQPGSDDSLEGSWLYVGEVSETFSQGGGSGTYSGVWVENYYIVDSGSTIDLIGCDGIVGPELFPENDGNVTLVWGEEEYFGVNSNNALLDFGTNDFDYVEDGMTYAGQSTTAFVKLSSVIDNPVGVLNIDDTEVEISCVRYANMLEVGFDGDRQQWYHAIFKSVDGQSFYFFNEEISSMDFSGRVISITFEDESKGLFTFY